MITRFRRRAASIVAVFGVLILGAFLCLRPDWSVVVEADSEAFRVVSSRITMGTNHDTPFPNVIAASLSRVWPQHPVPILHGRIISAQSFQPCTVLWLHYRNARTADQFRPAESLKLMLTENGKETRECEIASWGDLAWQVDFRDGFLRYDLGVNPSEFQKCTLEFFSRDVQIPLARLTVR